MYGVIWHVIQVPAPSARAYIALCRSRSRAAAATRCAVHMLLVRLVVFLAQPRRSSFHFKSNAAMGQL